MKKGKNWQSFIDDHGDFELASYLYRAINDLMKQALDMGTLLSNDKTKLRAFREQVKKAYKAQWLEVAEALASFDLIVPCGCAHTDYCRACGGSRYRLNETLSPDELRENTFAFTDESVAEQLMAGHQRALAQVERLGYQIIPPDSAAAE